MYLHSESRHCAYTVRNLCIHHTLHICNESSDCMYLHQSMHLPQADRPPKRTSPMRVYRPKHASTPHPAYPQRKSSLHVSHLKHASTRSLGIAITKDCTACIPLETCIGTKPCTSATKVYTALILPRASMYTVKWTFPLLSGHANSAIESAY